MRNLNSPSLTLSRDTLNSAMTSVGWSPSLIADAELAMVELIVNAWRHGETASPVGLLWPSVNPGEINLQGRPLVNLGNIPASTLINLLALICEYRHNRDAGHHHR
ncbi:hypothetical protein ACH4E7_18870 [Kitasatospora sp. NPDC018058]|uniref:hypothetical protein n=1 Tax=Kitasatospora sp. NPDC018058 TaxID=3364025 RepID=UPI0037BFC762